MKTAKQQLAEAMPEAELQNNIIGLAKLLGYKVYHTHDSRRSEGGFPDLVLCRAPVTIIAECKREKKQLRKDQKEWMDLFIITAVASHGAVKVCLWRPSDWLSGSIERVLK